MVAQGWDLPVKGEVSEFRKFAITYPAVSRKRLRAGSSIALLFYSSLIY